MNFSDSPDQARGHSTMHDVATVAGVSMKSVSRVINNEPHVSMKLRSKVEAAIAALKYVPDAAARSLAGARSFTIGVLFDNPSPNYTMMIVAGAYQACIEQQYHLRIDTLDSSPGCTDLEGQLDQILRNNRSDGFILTPPLSDHPVVIDYLEARAIRYSRVAPTFEPERSAAVQIDDAAAAAQVAEMFWAKGHRRFGLVNGPPEHGAALTRRNGFLNRLREFDPSVNVSQADGGFSFEGGIQAGKDLLSTRRHPTAIFAANDDSAAGVMVACSQFNLRVPDDVSICGFDDSWVAKSVWPYLTTIRQPISEMAHGAAMLLLDRSLPQDHAVIRRLDFKLIMRGSVSGPK
jgi:LacI family transcriptional regulator